MSHNFICPPHQYYKVETVALPVEELSIQFDQNNVTITIDAEIVDSSSRMSGRGHRVCVFSRQEFEKLPHDMVAGCVDLPETDKPLTKIQRLRDDSDRLTPDGINQLGENRFEVVEVKTYRNPHSLHIVAENALEKYSEPLKRRAVSNEITFRILVVSSNCLITNYALTEEHRERIVSHYLLGIRIHNLALNEGWVFSGQEEDSKLEGELLGALSTIGLDDIAINIHGDREPLWITNDMKRGWDNNPVISIPQIMSANYADACVNYAKDKKNLTGEDPEDSDKTREGFDLLRQKVNDVGKSSAVKTVISYPIADVEMKSYEPSWPKSLAAELSNKMGTENATSRLWKSAFWSAYTHQDNFEEISADHLRHIALKIQGYETLQSQLPEKSTHFVIEVSPTPEDRVDLAKRGIQSKALKDDINVKNHQAESRKPLSYDTETFDIDRSFKEITDLLKPRDKNERIPLEKDIRELIDEGLKLGESKDCLPEILVRKFSSTKFAGMMSFMQDVIGEVNLTRLKYTKRDRLVIKRLPGYNAYVLIKTTSNDGPVFYSVAVPKESFKGSLPLSEEWLENDNFKYTKFVSIDRHKITHKLYSLQKACSLFFFWCHQHGVLPRKDMFKRPLHKRVVNHWWASVLVHLEDKESTSRNLQLIRYAYMEMVKGGPCRPKPEKIVEKMDFVVRSRLLLWCYKRVAETFITMSVSPPVTLAAHTAGENDEDSQDSTEKLLSWVDGFPIDRFEIALNLSYLGVLHNKEESNQTHSNLKIFDKLISEELSMPFADPEDMTNGQRIRAESLKNHEFSAIAVKSFARAARNEIEKKHGDYNTWAKQAILKAVMKRTFEELATSKSSAADAATALIDDIIEDRYGDGETPEQKHQRGQEARSKCIENIAEVIKEINPDSCHVFIYIRRILDRLESKGGITAALFKKLQIGGTREIFILNIWSRIMINFVETICRVICEELNCEMLTKGDQKVSRSDEHFEKVRQKMKGRHQVTVISSDDAARWAQQFVMPCFGAMLNELVPKPFLNPCLRVLNLITCKRLELPLELLDLFYKRKEVLSFSPNMNKLKEEFLDATKTDDPILVKAGSKWMKNRSNMMQGILHYTSSLLHACYMTALTAHITAMILKTPQTSIERVVVTGKVSSDDSSIMLSFGFSDRLLAPKIVVFATIMCYLKRQCYPLICAKQSDAKSTLASAMNLEEFNSLWFFKNTVLTPSIKFVAQACRTHVTDKLENRQEVMAGLRAQVLEYTGSTLLTSIVQSCQSRCHYTALGIRTHKLFLYYKNLLIENPHPCLGFFLFEHHMTCGMLGLNFALYLASRNSIETSRLCRLLGKTSLLDGEDSELGNCKLVLTQGSTTRYERMLSRMGCNYDQEIQYFDDNPTVACRPPFNREEILHRIMLKATTPSLANAFEFLTDSKLHAASAYTLHADCVRVRERQVLDISDDGAVTAEVKTEKKSLLKALTDIANKKDLPLTDNEERWIFPLRELYQTARAEAYTIFNAFSMAVCRRQKNRYVIHHIPKQEISFPLPPLEVAKLKWFAMRSPGTLYEVGQTWTNLQLLVPWIRDTLKETLLSSPMQSTIGVLGFLRSLNKRSGSIRLIGPCRKQPSHFRALRNIMSCAYWPEVKFIEREVVQELPPLDHDPIDPDLPWSEQMEVEERRQAAEEERQRQHAETQEQAGTSALPPPSTPTAIANQLFSCLWLASESDTPHVRETVIRAFEECPDIVDPLACDSENTFRSLTPMEAKLAILQLAIKHSHTNLSAVLATAKRGLRGGFTTRADFDNAQQRYIGRAWYQGYFNNIPFAAEIEEPVLKCLVVHSKENLRTFLHGCKEVFRELRCSKMASDTVRQSSEYKKEKPKREKGLKFYDMNTGLQHDCPGENQIPVRFNRYLRVSDMGSSIRCVVAKEGKIRLLQEAHNRSVCALSFTPLAPRDLAPVSFLQLSKRDKDYYWYTVQPIPKKKASSLLDIASMDAKRYYQGGVVDRPLDMRTIWVTRTLRERLIHLGLARDTSIFSSKPSTANPDPVNPVDILGMTDEAFDMMMSEEDFYDLDNMLNIDRDFITQAEEHTQRAMDAENRRLNSDQAGDRSMEEEELILNRSFDIDLTEDYDETSNILELFSEDRDAILSRRQLTTSASHPFWDELINYWKEFASNDRRSEAIQGRFSENDSALTIKIARLFGARMSEEEKSLMEGGSDEEDLQESPSFHETM